MTRFLILSTSTSLECTPLSKRLTNCVSNALITKYASPTNWFWTSIFIS